MQKNDYGKFKVQLGDGLGAVGTLRGKSRTVKGQLIKGLLEDTKGLLRDS